MATTEEPTAKDLGINNHADYVRYLVYGEGYPLKKRGVLVSHIGIDGDECFDVNELMVCIGEWSDGTFSVGTCSNNVESVFDSLDMRADPFGVVKIWMYPNDESFGIGWHPKQKPLYHAKSEGGTGWMTSEEQMSSESVGEGSKEAAPLVDGDVDVKE